MKEGCRSIVDGRLAHTDLKSSCLLHVVTADLKPDLMRQAYVSASPPVHDPLKDGDSADSLITPVKPSATLSLGSGLRKRRSTR